VTLFEADTRLGGRILTHYFDDEHFGELGAMRIPLDHSCTWRYVQEFNLQPADFVQTNINTFYYLRGRRFPREPWQPLDNAAPGLYPSVRPQVGRPQPTEVLDQIVGALMDKLAGDVERWDAFGGTLQSRRLQQYDRYSVWQHIKGLLARPSWLRQLAQSTDSALNDQEWEYIGRATSMLWDEKISYLEALVDSVPHYYPFMSRIEGGMELLVKRFEDYAPESNCLQEPSA
jgi:hypothetical protein